MRSLLSRLLLIAVACAGAAVAERPAWRWSLPAGVAAPPVPADNPMSAAKVALGRRLFYDGRLSVGGTMSCATCHQQNRGFASATVTEPGIGGDPGRRNVPGLANVAWIAPLTWHDPRIRTLEGQLATPLFGTNPVEMAARPAEIVARLEADGCYRSMFAAAFPASGGRIDLADMTKAIAAFQRTLVSYGSPYDRFTRGDRSALAPAAQRGAATFAQACGGCHSGPNFSDGRFYALRAPSPLAEDHGLEEATGRPEDAGRFRTAPLRNVALTAPYFHDGSVATLPEAVRLHAAAAPLPTRAIDDLVAFLDALTDAKFVTDPALARPVLACGSRPTGDMR